MGRDPGALVLCPSPPLGWPAMADKITMGADGKLRVPDEPIIPFIEGDGTGVDIWPAAQRVIDAAVAKHGSQDRLDRGARRGEGVQGRPATGCPKTPLPPSAST